MTFCCHCNVKPHLKLNIHTPSQPVSNPRKKQEIHRDFNLGNHNAKWDIAFCTSWSTVLGYSSISVMQLFLLGSEFVRRTHNKHLETQKPGRKSLSASSWKRAWWLSTPRRRYLFSLLRSSSFTYVYPFLDDLTFPASFQGLRQSSSLQSCQSNWSLWNESWINEKLIPLLAAGWMWDFEAENVCICYQILLVTPLNLPLSLTSWEVSISCNAWIAKAELWWFGNNL